jgi:hypothetical protein
MKETQHTRVTQISGSKLRGIAQLCHVRGAPLDDDASPGRIHAARDRPGRVGSNWIFILLLWALVCTSTPRRIFAQQAASEYEVKAAYLFNFLKFVEWPADMSPSPSGKWVIGVVGVSPFGDELAQVVSGKVVQGHELQVKNFQAAEDVRTCHILFISDSERKRIPAILTALSSSSVLTVGDMDNFTRAGGMIQFVMEDGRVRFVIDVGAASRARLKISSKLLSLARDVTGAERVGNN